MSMSVTGFSSDPNKMYKNSFHWRNDSGELDVFEAAGYFSSVNIDQNPGAYIVNGVNFAQKFIRDEKQQHVQRAAAARMSLDMPIRNPIPAEFHIMDQKQMIKEKKKHKQPSSPGGRLASFLNSLFSQTHLKKKKSKSGSTMKDSLEEESPGGRRKRRSSISHFRITSSTISSTAASTDSKSSLFSSSSSGFRTPPPYANTPTKSYKEFRNLADLQQEISRTQNSGNFRPTLEKALFAEKKVTDYAWMEEKYRISSGDPGKNSRNGNPAAGIPTRNSTTNWEFRKFSNADDGADSDSSSDLFDLPSHELDFYSSSLPVYETTHLDRIKIGTQIPSAATV
ncbi:UNVERIFIED_CONTAM: Protein BIG GRAIN 1-like E [Sesamum indicum]